VAAVVWLLDATLLRVGNEEYVRDNRSFGLTTLRNRHVAIEGTVVTLSFRGKSGKAVTVGLRDRRLARVIREVQELPGQRVFQYVDDAGEVQPIDSDDVNEYLRAAMGDDFSAKDFRTWAGTVLAATALARLDEDPDDGDRTPTKARVVEAVKEVARSLGNTPAVCRASYIHPEIVDAYLDGSLAESAKRATTTRRGSGSQPGLDGDERLVFDLLRRRTGRTAAAA